MTTNVLTELYADWVAMRRLTKALRRLAQSMETEVAEPAAAPVAPAEPTTKPEEKEDVESIERRARKPPKDGPCKGCGKNVPLNRLMLCYPCWVKKQNTDKGWREGQPHPAGCGCDLDCRLDAVTPNN